MFHPNDLLADDVNDDIGDLISQINSHDGWNNNKRALVRDLKSALTKKQYCSFTGHVDRYIIRLVGQSAIVYVPLGRRGLLSGYAGGYVRIVCVGSGRYDRQYMVGKVPALEYKPYFSHREISGFKSFICLKGEQIEEHETFYLTCYTSDPTVEQLANKSVYSPQQGIPLQLSHEGTYRFAYRIIFDTKYSKEKPSEIRFIGLSVGRHRSELCAVIELRRPTIVNSGDKVWLPQLILTFAKLEYGVMRYLGQSEQLKK